MCILRNGTVLCSISVNKIVRVKKVRIGVMIRRILLIFHSAEGTTVKQLCMRTSIVGY